MLGDCNPDVLVLGGDVTPAFGQQEKLVGSIDLVVGGSAAITAVAAARLGLSVALVAAVGADPAGAFMLDQLTREGVDVSAVVIRAQTPTGMTVALSRGRDRAILTALGAMTSLTAADVPGTLLARARHVHVSSYFLLEDSLGPGLAGLLSAARAGGATTSLDTNWDPSERWGDERLAAAIAQTDLLLPNEAEALRLSGAGSLDAAVSALGAVGRRLVVKLGERGVICADRLRALAPGERSGGDAGRYHGSGRLLQRRPDRRPAPRPRAARGRRAWLRHRRALHWRPRRHGQRPRPADRSAAGRPRVGGQRPAQPIGHRARARRPDQALREALTAVLAQGRLRNAK